MLQDGRLEEVQDDVGAVRVQEALHLLVEVGLFRERDRVDLVLAHKGDGRVAVGVRAARLDVRLAFEGLQGLRLHARFLGELRVLADLLADLFEGSLLGRREVLDLDDVVRAARLHGARDARALQAEGGVCDGRRQRDAPDGSRLRFPLRRAERAALLGALARELPRQAREVFARPRPRVEVVRERLVRDDDLARRDLRVRYVRGSVRREEGLYLLVRHLGVLD